MKKLLIGFLIFTISLSANEIVVKREKYIENNNSEKAYPKEELIAQQLSKILKMVIIEVSGKNRYSKDKDLDKVSTIIKVLISKNQADVKMKSAFPNENSSVLVRIYDTPAKKNICATIDSNRDFLIIDVKGENGTICNYLDNYIKSTKYTILK